MLNREELYTKEIKEARAEAISSEKMRGKLLLILNLFFAIVIVLYLIYIVTSDNERNYSNTKVLGVSYTPKEVKYDETELLEQQLMSVEVDTLNDAIKSNIYNSTKNQIIITGKNSDNEEFKDVRVVDDKGEFKGATVVDDKNGDYRDVTVVDDRDEYKGATVVKKAI